jgi:hypothetical protein
MSQNKKRPKKRYKNALEMVISEINEMDHYGVISSGAPLDEYKEEAQKILAVASKCKTWQDLREEIFKIFDRSFGGDAGKIQDYDDISKNILEYLSDK